MNTPIRIGDRVHNATHGSGTVEGFDYPEGEGEHVRVLWDSDPLTVSMMQRFRLQRILIERPLRVGPA